MTDLSPDVQALLDESYKSDLTEKESERLLLLCGHSIRHGLAAVLRHLVDTEADSESWGAVPANRLEGLADALTAPSLMERAMKGNATAARQFLHEAGFTDKQGQWLPQYQPILEVTND